MYVCMIYWAAAAVIFVLALLIPVVSRNDLEQKL